MNRLLILFFMGFLVMGCGDGKKQKDGADSQEVALESENADNVPFPIYDFDRLEPLLHKDDDQTYIINFWATWCKPCLEELPYFEKVGAEQKDNKVKVILVSLDMPHMWKSRLEPYVKNKGIESEVVILDDPKQNEWIPKVNEEWGGGIPATLIYNKGKRSFFEHGFTYEELNAALKDFVQKTDSKL
ncbi:TlpA family protein disulfide reductase [Flagellimonas aequoris]|uniref:TlpA family protein disulfide reductase n=2 Tax=Flagellimonas aequoris TaxID=2306997 RepID=A0A418N2H9_9FLAO|nr:TlpA family protein disulfide reductase [Allomuricauda aequoris]TXJ99353.1 TlpA family protein disulfide reductase [Allomuricauda aequoris]